jgi:tRNA nucleotidyltransferase (CCA-adding enzyme)
VTQRLRTPHKNAQGLRVSDLMRPAKVVTPNLRATEALTLMQDQQLDALVVVSGRTVLGIASARDLEDTTLGLKPVAAVMSTRPVCVPPELELSEAAQRMRGRSVGSLPVVAGSRVVGLVTTADLLERLSGATVPQEK